MGYAWCRRCQCNYPGTFVEDGLCRFCIRDHKDKLEELYRQYQEAQAADDLEGVGRLAHDIAAYQLETGYVWKDGPKNLRAKLP